MLRLVVGMAGMRSRALIWYEQYQNSITSISFIDVWVNIRVCVKQYNELLNSLPHCDRN